MCSIVSGSFYSTLYLEIFIHIVSYNYNLFFHWCIIFLCKNGPQFNKFGRPWKHDYMSLKSFPMCASSLKLNDLIKGVVEALSPERVGGEESISGSVFAKHSAWAVRLNGNHCPWRQLPLLCRWGNWVWEKMHDFTIGLNWTHKLLAVADRNPVLAKTVPGGCWGCATSLMETGLLYN